jgi:hypothetical protein
MGQACSSGGDGERSFGQEMASAVHAGSKHELLFPMLPIGDGPRDKY